jgi:hypothetical protein
MLGEATVTNVVLSGQPEERHDKSADKTSQWGNTNQKPPKCEAAMLCVLRKSEVRMSDVIMYQV